jgi:hypothetical protein
MIPRIRWVSLASAALLTVATACLAAEESPGYRTGKASVGGQLGGSYFGVVDRLFGQDWFGDYSEGAWARFAFAATFRYVSSPHFRWQVSPGFTWTGYRTGTEIPFPDLNFPEDTTKDQMLSTLLPVTVQAQYVIRRGWWYYHVGLGPGIYQVEVENHRKTYKDPVTYKLHRGLYAGATFELGAERFLKGLTSTSVEVTLTDHLVFAQRDDQFVSGFNSNLMATELRIGVNYYFDPLTHGQKKAPAGIPPAR